MRWLPSPLSSIDPVAIEALPDGSVLILDRSHAAYSQILRFVAMCSWVIRFRCGNCSR